MIADKFVDLYARYAELRDRLVAERDVVLTCALDALIADGVLSDLAFKGGTCLRKVVFDSSGRFSEDLDFSVATELPEDDVLMRLVEVLNPSDAPRSDAGMADPVQRKWAETRLPFGGGLYK